MNNHFLHLFITFITLSTSIASTTTPINELSVLESIKNSINDPTDELKDWQFPQNQTNSENPPKHCSWKSISCNSNGFIESLNLSNMNLNGSISESIQFLTSLTSIDLTFNNFAGTFPNGLSTNAKKLVYINASSNNFVGPIPEDIGNATSLETLDFRGSFFEGSIPKCFKNLQKLKFLGLSRNNSTGALPAEVGELSSLETMILGYNSFEFLQNLGISVDCSTLTLQLGV